MVNLAPSGWEWIGVKFYKYATYTHPVINLCEYYREKERERERERENLRHLFFNIITNCNINSSIINRNTTRWIKKKEKDQENENENEKEKDAFIIEWKE